MRLMNFGSVKKLSDAWVTSSEAKKAAEISDGRAKVDLKMPVSGCVLYGIVFLQ
jgi:hypothetical protein